MFTLAEEIIFIDPEGEKLDVETRHSGGGNPGLLERAAHALGFDY